MENTTSELMRNYVNSQKFSNTTEIMEAMKDLFRDVLQQVMEGELEEQLGHEKARDCRKPKKMCCRKITEMGTQKRA